MGEPYQGVPPYFSDRMKRTAKDRPFLTITVIPFSLQAPRWQTHSPRLIFHRHSYTTRY